jgi:uncharacterized membrane protein
MEITLILLMVIVMIPMLLWLLAIVMPLLLMVGYQVYDIIRYIRRKMVGRNG